MGMECNSLMALIIRAYLASKMVFLVSSVIILNCQCMSGSP